MRRAVTLLSACLFALALLATTSLITTTPASAATIAPTTTCSNGVDNTGGLGLICEVTIVNTITASGGSATVTVRECHGAAGDPTALCSTQVTVLTEPVTAVTQCNSSINGGGGTLRCTVQVTNNFIGVSPGATAATVNQCVGSGGGITVGCDPFPATTSGATITQCNGSANGGTLVGLNCDATGTESSAGGVMINQCNGSANGGGALVICSANIDNNVVVAPTPVPAPTATPAPSATPAPGATAAPVATPAPAGPGAPGASVAPFTRPAPEAPLSPFAALAPPRGPGSSAPGTPSTVTDVVTEVPTPLPDLPDTSFIDQLIAQVNSTGPLVLAGVALAALALIAAFTRRTAATVQPRQHAVA